MSSNLPQQVLAQAAEAERLEKALQGDSAPATPDPEPAPAEPPVASQEPPPEPTPPPKPADEPNWQQRYLSLQGIFNAEMPKLQNRVKELEAQIAAASAKPVEPPKPPEALPRLVTDKDVETFGGELIDLIRRQAQEVSKTERAALEQEINKLRAENTELKQNVGSVAERQTKSSLSVYETDLTKAVPDWAAINVNTEFHQWLMQPDPLSGIQRQALLQNAYNTFDVARTTALFNAFKTEKKIPLPNVQATPPAPSPELARQVAPGTSRSAPATPPAAPERIWSQDEIGRFYTDVAKGVYAGKADEAAKIEAQIDAAVAAGRVRM